ncbi:MAG: ATP cone domain-containing protein [Candidimonas sp.]
MIKNIHVVKRDGKRELLDLTKFHKMVEEACDGLAGVSASQIEMKSGIQFFDGITTRDIQNILVKSAADLISLENPNYQYVAARLLMFGLRKDVFGQFEPLPLKRIIKDNIKRGLYDAEILQWYDDDEIKEMEQMVNWDRDNNFTYAGLRQIIDKYLVQDRVTGDIFEVPQYAYMLISATLFAKYDKDVRLSFVKKYYDAISGFKINIPTPVMAGVRTPIRQYASCVLVDVDDTLDSIFTSTTAIGKYVAQRAGIGVNFGRIRAIGSKIRDGEVIHTGVIPFLKIIEATVKSTSQNGIRGGSASIHFPVFHAEIEDILVLKNNKGTEDNRVRKLDYSIQLSKIFYERFLKGSHITLFSPHDVPGLYEAFGTPEFDSLYVKYENDKSVPKKTVAAQDLFSSLLKERAETGRIYIMNIDHCNTHSSFDETIYMSNLCLDGDTTLNIKEYGIHNDITLEELHENFHDNYEILSQNVHNGEKEYKKVTNSYLTSESANVLKITDNDSGYYIICTPDHEIYTQRGYVKAKDLKEIDNVVLSK